MPTVALNRDELLAGLGEQYSEEGFDQLCFEFGIELDEVTTEKQMLQKNKGDGAAGLEEASEVVVWKLDIPANRYDLLCLEGVVRALRIFLGKDKPPVYRAVEAASPISMTVMPETAQIRPFVVSAVLRGVTFTQQNYDSFIDLQDKLHHNICRKRTLVAIGTHDLDTLEPPFTFEALPPQEIKFVPLNQEEEVDCVKMFENFDAGIGYGAAQLKAYLPIIRDSPVYPVIFDAKRRVLSLPPIINGDHSKIALHTKNVLIECTATDHTKAMTVLQTVVSMFSQYCADPFTVEPVKVVYSEGSNQKWGTSVVCPDLEPRHVEASLEYIQSCTGIQPPPGPERVIELLDKMQLTATYDEAKGSFDALVGIARSDVLHACDVMEDVAIAYGFDNIPKTLPQSATVGKQQPINKLSDLLRVELAECGFTEVCTLALCSFEENFDFLRKSNEPETAVRIANPKTLEFQVVRTSLLPGMLKTVKECRKVALPLKLFEVSDIVLLDPTSDVGARNVRMMAGICVNKSSGFETIHGIVDRVMNMFGYTAQCAGGEGDKSYTVVAAPNPTFFPGRSADVMAGEVKVGSFGVLHPEVLESFGLIYPAAVFELSMEFFLNDEQKATSLAEY